MGNRGSKSNILSLTFFKAEGSQTSSGGYRSRAGFVGAGTSDPLIRFPAAMYTWQFFFREKVFVKEQRVDGFSVLYSIL